MKKNILIVLTVLFFIAGQQAGAITLEPDLYEKNRLLFSAAFLVMNLAIVLLVILSSLLYQNLKKMKRKSEAFESFNRLRKTFIDSDNRLIYLKDENLKYIFVNKAFKDFFQKSTAEIIGKDDFALTGEKYAELREKTDADVLKHKAPVVGEVKWKNRYYRINKFPVKLLNGRYGVGAYIEDVTDVVNSKKKEEKTLLRNSILVDAFSRVFASSQDQLDYVLNKALELTESKFGYIYYYDEESRAFILNSWSREAMAACQVANKQTRYRLEETGLWGEVVRQRKPLVINDYSAANLLKKGCPEGHVPVKKFMSVPVIIEGKIVAVVGLANKEDDYDDNDVDQITVLMTGVWHAKEKREREQELEKANAILKENQDKLQLLLDSTAEAIYGLDLDGICTFCNTSCAKLLGYQHQDELIGKNMHYQIHHSRRDGTPIPLDACRISQASKVGQGMHADDEVFWRADGTYFAVEYFSYPQYKDGKIVGTVVTFMDITERKKAEAKIRFLSYHDSLTGLYNRAFFEEELKRLDTARNYPISIIMSDVNGLKLTNDIFGHAAGDKLLRKVAQILKQACRADDIIARIGGDEFVILLPKTTLKEAEAVALRIKNEYAKENVNAVKASISMGCAVKESAGEDIFHVLHTAEDKMYLDKTLNRKNIDRNLIKTIMDTLHKNNPREKEHSQRVSALCEKIGEAMHLPAEKIKMNKDAGFYHDIGKIAWDAGLFNKEAS